MGVLAGVAFVDVLPNMKKFGAALTAGVSEQQKATAAKIGKIGLVMGAGIAYGIHKAVSSAVDLNEAQSALTYTFGKQTKQVQAWSKSQTDAFSEVDFDSKIKDMSSFGRAAGLSGEDMAMFSKKTLDAAQDLSSFHNVKIEDAIQDVGFALQGTAQPMRKYGILIDQATIKAKALSEGIIHVAKDTTQIKQAQTAAEIAQTRYTEAVAKYGKTSTQAKSAGLSLAKSHETLKRAVKGTIPELTASETVLATQKFILDNLGPAAGDFGRTSGQAAGQQRIMAANTADLVATLGKGLLPTYTSLLHIGIAFAAFLAKHTSLVKLLVGVTIALTTAMLIYSGTVKVVTAFQAIWLALTGAQTAATEGATVAQTELDAAMIANPIGLVVVAIAALVAGLILAYKKSETFRTIVNATFNAVKVVVGAVVGFIRKHWLLLAVILTGAVLGPVILIIAKFNSIKAVIMKVVGFIRDHWRLLLTIILLPVAPILALILNFNKIKGVVSTVISYIKGKWGDFVGYIRGVPGKLASAGSGMFDWVKDSFRSAFNSVITWWNNLQFTFGGIHGHGGFSVGTPDIPLLARGGFLPAGALGIVGERGPEFAIGGRAGTAIIPNRGAMRIVGTLDLGDGLEGRIDGVIRQHDSHSRRLERMG